MATQEELIKQFWLGVLNRKADSGNVAGVSAIIELVGKLRVTNKTRGGRVSKGSVTIECKRATGRARDNGCGECVTIPVEVVFANVAIQVAIVKSLEGVVFSHQWVGVNCQFDSCNIAVATTASGGEAVIG